MPVIGREAVDIGHEHRTHLAIEAWRFVPPAPAITRQPRSRLHICTFPEQQNMVNCTNCMDYNRKEYIHET